MKNYIGKERMNFFFVGLFVFAGLSLSSCNNEDDVENYAEHTLKGVVQDESGVAIPAVQVIVKSSQAGWKNDTLITNSEGAFAKKYKISGNADVDYNIFFNDIDGESNGSYKTDSVKVSFTKAELKDGNGSFLGSAEKEANIKLTPAE